MIDYSSTADRVVKSVDLSIISLMNVVAMALAEQLSNVCSCMSHGLPEASRLDC